MRVDLILSVIVIGVLAAQAQDATGHGAGPGPGRPFESGVGFTALDINGDGVLDAGEIAAAAKSLKKLDKNSDGQITQDEVRLALPMHRERGGPGGERGREREGATSTGDETVKILMAFDAYGDGKLSAAFRRSRQKAGMNL